MNDTVDTVQAIIAGIREHKGDGAGLLSWIAQHKDLFTEQIFDALLSTTAMIREPFQIGTAKFVFQALAIVAKEQANHTKAVDVLIDQGKFLEQYGILDDALDCYRQAAQIAQEHLDSDTHTNCLIAQASLYQRVHLYKKALSLFEQVYERCQKSDDRRFRAGSMGNLAIAYRTLGEYTRALDFHTQALAIFRSEAEFFGMLDVSVYEAIAIELYNMGLTYGLMEDNGHALACFDEGLKTIRSHADRAKFMDKNALMKQLMSLTTQEEQPGPYAELEIHFLVEISRHAQRAGNEETQESARKEAASLVQKYRLNNLERAVRKLFVS
jgi:tetratricopeptide (TPR) repeat protein